MKLILRLRTESGHGYTTVWIIGRQGDISTGLLHGGLPDHAANALAASMEAMGFEIERTTLTTTYGEMAPPERAARQADLFERENI